MRAAVTDLEQRAPAGAPLVRLLTSRPAHWKDALRRRLLAAADVLSVQAGALAAGFAGEPETTLFVCATLPLWIVLSKINGLYDQDHIRVCHQTTDDASRVFHWVTLASGATAVVLPLVFGAPMSAEAAIAMWAVAFGAALPLRAAARFTWRRLVEPERGLVVGSGALADALARKLVLEQGHHLTLAGRLTLDGEGGQYAGGDGEPRAASLDDIESLMSRGRYERVILALEDLDERTLSHTVAACRDAGVKFSVAPPLRAMLGTAVELNHLAELPLIEFRTWDPSRSTMLLKRTIDLAVATIALVVLAPLLACVAIAIRLDTPGPAIFRQRRAGRNGAPFRMLKFRTMVRDAEGLLPEVLALDELEEPVFKLQDDPRITRVGRLLRRYSVDELPQLVNVIRGDMSLVGPRPEEVWLAERYGEAEAFRLSMRPGITGPMQVHGRGELSFQERMAVEREYVENYSLRKDLKIMLKTVPAVVNGLGAY